MKHRRERTLNKDKQVCGLGKPLSSASKRPNVQRKSKVGGGRMERAYTVHCTMWCTIADVSIFKFP